jgi:SNF2 family DNA or RNA helicase
MAACPIITPYTEQLGIPPNILEKLWEIRTWDIDAVKAGTLNSIPFRWPSLLKRQFVQAGELHDLILRQYQLQQIFHLTRMNRFINGDGVGLGKTVGVIASACWVKEREPDTKFLVLTTKSTTLQWAEEVQKFSDLRPFVVVDEYRGQTSYKARLQQVSDFLKGDKKDVLICKYTSVIGRRKRVEGQFDEDGNPVGDSNFALISDEIKEFCLIAEKYRDRLVVVVDECQKFKTVGSANRQLVSNLCKRTDRVWALTATAVKNDLAEFYSIASAIGIRPFGYMDEFKEQFCLYAEKFIGYGKTTYELQGYHNLPSFRNGLRPFFLGRSQAQVKEPLPKLSTSFIPVDLSPEQVKLLLHDIPDGTYKLPPAVIKVAGEWKERERNPDNLMTMMSVYQLVANHPGLIDPLDKKKYLSPKLSPKEEDLLDLLDGELEGEKVIVYTKYRTWIDRLEAITKAGQFTKRKFLRITGNENEKQRAVNKKLFQENADHDLIVINNAGMEGINLQQAAHMILLDCPWSWGDLLQLVGRMMRMASPHSACTLHVMTAKGTMDEYTIEILKSKKGVFETILGESHSAGILDNNLLVDLDSGMDQVSGSDDEFKKMLTAHVRKVGMRTITEGFRLQSASTDEDYKMLFEAGEQPRKTSKKKFSQLQEKYKSKWSFPEDSK